MDGDLSYLEPGFKANTLKIPQIKKILVFHNVAFPSNYKKAQLVKLFNEKIGSRSKELLREYQSTLEKAGPIEDAHHKTNAESDKKSGKKSSISESKQHKKNPDVTEVFSSSSDDSSSSGSDSEDAVVEVEHIDTAKKNTRSSGRHAGAGAPKKNNDIAEKLVDSSSEISGEAEEIEEIGEVEEMDTSGGKAKKTRSKTKLKKSDSKNSESLFVEESDDEEKEEVSFNNNNSFQAGRKGNKRRMTNDISDEKEEPEKKKAKDLFDFSGSEVDNSEEFETLLTKSLKDSTQILKSPQRELKHNLKEILGSNRKKLINDSDQTNKFKIGKSSTTKTVADLRSKASPLKNSTPKKLLISKTPSKTPSKVRSTPKPSKSKDETASPMIAKSIDEKESMNEPFDADLMAKELGINVIKNSIFNPATTDIVFKPTSNTISSKSFKKNEEESVEDPADKVPLESESSYPMPIEVSDDEEELQSDAEEASNINDDEDDEDEDEIRDITEEFSGTTAEKESQNGNGNENENENEKDESSEDENLKGPGSVFDKVQNDLIDDDEELIAATEETDKTIENLSSSSAKYAFFSYFKYFTIFLLMTTFSGLGYWYADQKVLVGYCGYSIDRKTIPNPNENPYIDLVDEFLLQYLKPQCVPCPDNATCYPYFDLSCHDDFLEIKPITYYLTGKRCIPDLRKQRRIENMIAVSLDILRSKNAAVDCGQGCDNEAGLTAEVLYDILSNVKSPGVSNEEFDEIWQKAEEYLENHAEIVTFFEKVSGSERSDDEGSPTQVTKKGLRSTSMENLNFQCRSKTIINLVLIKYKNYIMISIGCLSIISVAHLIISQRYAKQKEIFKICDAVVEKLRDQQLMSKNDPTGTIKGYLESIVLRDELLSNDNKNKIVKWKKVTQQIEVNPSVRVEIMEIYGEIKRIWAWTGR